jgi:hypothetical protein
VGAAIRVVDVVAKGEDRRAVVVVVLQGDFGFRVVLDSAEVDDVVERVLAVVEVFDELRDASLVVEGFCRLWVLRVLKMWMSYSVSVRTVLSASQC